MKKTVKRLKNRSGFTLVELLMTVMILLLATAIVVAGVPAAINVYYDAVDAANAQTLLSTTMIRLRDEFCTATEITVSGDAITYRDSDGHGARLSQTGGTNSGSQGGTSGQAAAPGIYKTFAEGVLGSGTDTTGTSETVSSQMLVSQLASGNKKMYIQYELDTDAYSAGVLTFKTLQVFKGTSGDPIAQVTDFRVRVLTDTTA